MTKQYTLHADEFSLKHGYFLIALQGVEGHDPFQMEWAGATSFALMPAAGGLVKYVMP